MAFDIVNQAVGLWENLSGETNPSMPHEKKKEFTTQNQLYWNLSQAILSITTRLPIWPITRCDTIAEWNHETLICK